MRYRVLAFAALISATVVLAGPSVAQPYRARQGVQSGEMRSLDEILNGIRRQRPGNLADVQGPNPSPAGEPQYRLKWVTPDGRVLWLDTDARTGRVLGVEGDDRAPRAAPPRGFFGPPPGAGPPPPGAYNGPPGPYNGGPPPPRFGRFVPPGFGPTPGAVAPQPQGFGPGPGLPPGAVPQAGPPVPGPRGFGPGPGYGPRGFGMRAVPPGFGRIPPGRERGPRR